MFTTTSSGLPTPPHPQRGHRYANTHYQPSPAPAHRHATLIASTPIAIHLTYRHHRHRLDVYNQYPGRPPNLTADLLFLYKMSSITTKALLWLFFASSQQGRRRPTAIFTTLTICSKHHHTGLMSTINTLANCPTSLLISRGQQGRCRPPAIFTTFTLQQTSPHRLDVYIQHPGRPPNITADKW